jgi:TPR repeat protein
LISTAPYIRLMIAASPEGFAGGASGLLSELARRAYYGQRQAACNLAFLSMRPYYADFHVTESSIDLAKALSWYRRAAEDGSSQAQFWLGRFYEEGKALPANKTMAAAYYLLSAKQGYAAAEARLGHMLMQGELGPADPVSAVYWLRPAAAFGNPVALLDLGILYYDGSAGFEDKAIGLAMIRKAASNDFGSAARNWLSQRQGPEFTEVHRSSFGPNPDDGGPGFSGKWP